MLIFRIGILFIFSEIFVSCGNASEIEQQEVLPSDASTNYGSKSVTFPKLSEAARAEVIKWSVFEDYENEVKNVNGANIETLLSSTDRLLLHTDSLVNSIPKRINTPLIVSRLVVAKTRVALLHQQVRMSRLDSATIATDISELNIATNDLLNQIAEQLTKETIDEQQKEEAEKELQKQKKFRDSVYQAELRDKSNG